MTLHELLYANAPLARPSIAELSRVAPVRIVLAGDPLPLRQDGFTVLVDRDDVSDACAIRAHDRDGRLRRALRAVRPTGPYTIVDGRVA